MKILITGFDPFGGEKINPSYEAIKSIEDSIGDILIFKAEIPTVFRRSIDSLEKWIKDTDPDIVICVGQAGGRPDISVERVAINIDDARIPDNSGAQPIDEKICELGPSAYFSNLPVKGIVTALLEAKLPSSLSNSAGTFVCNHIMYGLMHLIHTKYPHIKGGFIHVPNIPEQLSPLSELPSLKLSEITQGLRIAIIAATENKQTENCTLGTIC